MPASSGLKIIRHGAKVTELTISEETRAKVEEIQSKFFGPKARAKYLKEVLGFSLCCCCRGIPFFRIEYDLKDGFKQIEMYCETCAKQLWERDDPKDRDELATKYHCVIGELPKTVREV